MNFEKRKEALWAKWGRNLGMSLSEDFRTMFEDGLGFKDEEVDLKDLNGLLSDFFDRVKALDYLPSRKKPKHPAQKRYQRSFNKRLYLVDFIIGQQLTIRNLRRKSFALHRRINWKQACKAWNEAHPHDPVTPEVLKATYYRAIVEEDIQREYFDRKYSEYAARFGQLLSRLIMENEQAFERFGKAFERFGQLVVAVFERVDQFTLNYKDNILALASLGDKLNSMTDADREKYIKLLEAEWEKQKGGIQNERSHTQTR